MTLHNIISLPSLLEATDHRLRLTVVSLPSCKGHLDGSAPSVDIPMVIIYDNCQITTPNEWPMYDMNKIKIEPSIRLLL
jgi:hypothetical protein